MLKARLNEVSFVNIILLFIAATPISVGFPFLAFGLLFKGEDRWAVFIFSTALAVAGCCTLMLSILFRVLKRSEISKLELSASLWFLAMSYIMFLISFHLT